MTIVAGFWYRDGLLLCADSLHTAYAHTVHEPKLFKTDCRLGSFVFGYAGNTSFAKAAILACQRKLAAAKSTADAVEILTQVIDKEYRRLVLSVPSYTADASYHYRLLIGMHTVDGKMALLSTEGPSMASCQEYTCLGIGDAIANYIMRAFPVRGMDLPDLLTAVIYMMARVKSVVPGCGGDTYFQLLSRSGRLTRAHKLEVDNVESVFKDFDELIAELLQVVGDRDMDDESYAEAMKGIISNLDFKRASIRGKGMEALLQRLEGLEVIQAGRADPQSTTLDEPIQQPSRELPEGTDES